MRAVIDTSVLIRHERGLGTRLPEDVAVSAATLAELGLGVLLTDDPGQRATRLATLTRVEREFEALPIDDPKQRQPDITLARELLGWSPEVSLREGLQRTIDQAGASVLVGEAS